MLGVVRPLDGSAGPMGRNSVYRSHTSALRVRAVGVELRISRVQARAKLSQNRSAADQDGVVAGLRARGDHVSADAVRATQGR